MDNYDGKNEERIQIILTNEAFRFTPVLEESSIQSEHRFIN